MSAFGAKTKKVLTYGKKKTRIINIHSDFSPTKDSETPPATPRRREAPTTPLRLKSTNNETPLKPRNNNTPLKAKSTKSSPKGSQKDAPLKQHTAQIRRAVYRTSPERVHVVRKPAPRRVHALRAMDRVEVTIETRAAESKPKPPPEARLKPLAEPKPVTKLQSEPKKQSKSNAKAGPSRQPAVVEDVAQQVIDLSISDDEEPVKRGKAPRKPRKTPKAKAAPPVPRQPTPPPTVEPEPEAEPPATAHDGLTSLLAQCTLSTPILFSEVFSHPAFSALVTGSEIKKQGEASYSEVFRVGDAVVKVIPLLGSEQPTDAEEDVPDCSPADDVAREIEVTRRMAQVPGGGFVGFRGAFVVTGSYPADLLAEWDRWESERGTESPRPIFTEQQRFALIVLDDGGGDLESARFDSHSWITMAAVFWQVCDALARAEKWTQFEHRDLHEGQILLHLTTPPARAQRETNYLADLGVTATIIDFGLSRLSIDEEVRWTPLPEEVYDGVGAQWDVYRAMRELVESRPPPLPSPPPSKPVEAAMPDSPPLRRRRPRRTTTRVVQYVLSDSEDDDATPDYTPDPSYTPDQSYQPDTPDYSRDDTPDHSAEYTPPTSTSPTTGASTPTSSEGGSETMQSPWTAFVPASNVLWLRYLCTYLLKAARKPYGRKSASAAKEAARQRQEAAWSMLCDVGAALDPGMGMFESAADVRAWGEECGWVG